MNQERRAFQRIPGFHKWPFGSGYKAELGVKKPPCAISETYSAMQLPVRHVPYR